MLPKILALIAREIAEWAQNQHATKISPNVAVVTGYATLLRQRMDVAALCAQFWSPLDIEHTAVDLRTGVEVAEFAFLMKPYVGKMVTAYEVYSGVNLVFIPRQMWAESSLGRWCCCPSRQDWLKKEGHSYFGARLAKRPAAMRLASRRPSI